MDRAVIEFIIKGFVVCIAFSVVFLLVLRILKIKTPKYVYIALIVLLLTWDNIYANIALYYFGLKNGGEHIYKVIENAEGFYHEGNTWGCDGVCEEQLMNREYKFIECNVTGPAYWIVPQSAFYVDRHGLYRFSLAKKGSPLCALYYEHNNRYPKQKNKNINDDPYCIASEKVTELKSRYSYSYRNDKKIVNPFISKTTSFITDLQTGERIAQTVTYTHYAGWMHYLYHGPTLGKHYPDTGLHRKVLYDTLRYKK